METDCVPTIRRSQPPFATCSIGAEFLSVSTENVRCVSGSQDTIEKTQKSFARPTEESSDSGTPRTPVPATKVKNENITFASVRSARNSFEKNMALDRKITHRDSQAAIPT